MLFRSIVAVVAVGILTAGCSAPEPQPTPSPSPTPISAGAPTPDALKQLENVEGKGYERIEGAPHSTNGSKFQTMLWMYGNDTRIEISNQFTDDREFEAVSIDIRLIDNTGPLTFWCGPTKPRDVLASVEAFREAVALMRGGGVKLTPTNRGTKIAELPAPHMCWVQYL